LDFGSFQLLPDQVDYGTFASVGSFLINSIATGASWIQKHADTGSTFGKPVSLLAFGIVLSDNFSQFIPFNASTGPLKLHGSGDGVTDDQGNYAKTSWVTSGFDDQVGGLLDYQWTQQGLSSAPAFSSSSSSARIRRQSTVANGTSPNGGYTSGPYSTVQTSSQLVVASNFQF